MKTVIKRTYIQMACTVKYIAITCILALFLPFYSAQASVLTNLYAFGVGTSCEGNICHTIHITGNLSYLDPNPNQFDVLTLASNGMIFPALSSLNLNMVDTTTGGLVDSLTYPYPNPSNVIQNLTLTEGLLLNVVNLTAYTHQNPLQPSDHAVWDIHPDSAAPTLRFTWNDQHGETVGGEIIFAVPEPGSFILFGLGLVSLLACRRLNTKVI